MFNYDLGGNSVDAEVSEGMAEIAFNKTLFVQKLTADDPIRPEVVNLQTVQQVFDHYKPNVDVEFTKDDGTTVTENLKFDNVGSFAVKNVIAQSKYLNNVNLEHDAYLKIMKQLKTNKALKLVVENPETKEAFVNALRALAAELDESE
jgi:ribosomal protein L25 (general stress protein Ctc)